MKPSTGVYKAAQLFRAGKGKVLIVTGGNLPWVPSERPEAELVRALLVEWGVPAAAIVLDGASRNTRDERGQFQGVDGNGGL